MPRLKSGDEFQDCPGCGGYDEYVERYIQEHGEPGGLCLGCIRYDEGAPSRWLRTTPKRAKELRVTGRVP